MKNAMASLAGRADGKVIQEIVRQRLGVVDLPPFARRPECMQSKP